MRMSRLAAFTLIVLLVAACGSPTAPNDPNPDTRCAYTLTDNVTTPTRLSPTDSQCDYLLSGLVSVTSELTIDPGTTIVAAPESRLVIGDAGSITANGTEAEPISLVGSAATQGSWYGICFSGRHLESSFDHVNIYWAGAIWSGGSSVCRAALGSVNEGGEAVHITNSTIVGAYTTGIDATQFALGEFRNNVLAGHGEYGLRVSPNNMGRLDSSTNYGGIGAVFEDGTSAENGRPYVSLNPTILTVVDVQGEYQHWVPVNVPYYVTPDERPYSRGAITLAENTTVVIAAGTQFVMAPTASITVDLGAMLGLDGTDELPVRFIGEQPTAGSWNGFLLRGGGLLADHVEISGAGNTSGLINRGAFTFSRVNGPSHCSHARNMTIRNSAANGVVIDDHHAGMVRFDTPTFENIALSEIVGENTGPAILAGDSCTD